MTAVATLEPGKLPSYMDGNTVLNALPWAVIVLDGDNCVLSLNIAAENLLASSVAAAAGRNLTDWVPQDSPLLGMIAQSRTSMSGLSDYDLEIESPRIGQIVVNVQIAPIPEVPGAVAVNLQERTIASKMHRQLSYRGAARSVSAMASMLAHEVKNPLSGIRGAAQLLEQSVHGDEQVLTRLICDETDRICALVDRMEVFSDERPIERTAVNIHEVLERCRRVAQNGFGKKVTFIERYDPSLPAVLGNHDLLVQVFLNLIKNASEAVPEEGGEITLTTSYRHGMRVAVAGSRERVHLPLQVTVQDNGPGIPEELQANLFEPFVTTKTNGSGLGLAFVAKAVADHGGVIEVDSVPRRTILRLTLPIVDAPKPRRVRRRRDQAPATGSENGGSTSL
ncbi:two-component system sensor histidine kinase NtrB [Thalassobaculum sp.]|uniref:two-component system sensor histidine kinase NtrB n=1 Tax=Thalassobaculum sp. TaxID=2022740 RepID=UPI003B595E32